MKSFLPLLATAVALVGFTTAAHAATSYSTGFEDFTTGPMSSSDVGPTQGGWSGGAQGGFTRNNTGDEEIVSTEAHSGNQSWHYANGYTSPGQGTPYTPNLTAAVANVGDSMTGSLWFKAGTAGDGSSLAIDTGNPAGDDRAEILAYIDNDAGGITVRSYTNGPAFDDVPIASGLDASIWHELTFSLTLTNTANDLSIAIDGGTPVDFEGSLKGYRDSIPAPYADSSRLKFVAEQNDPAYNGFYLDDISYSVSTSVPEPASLALLALGAATLLAPRRRRRQK